MRLNHLYTAKSPRTLFEEELQPLESSRYPQITSYKNVDSTPRINLSNKLDELDQIAKGNPALAYRKLREAIDSDVVSGLRGKHLYDSVMGDASEKLNNDGLPDYIVVAGDIDNMSHINDKSGLGTDGGTAVLAYAGELIETRFKNASDTMAYRKDSDSFAILTFIGDKSIREAQKVFVDMLTRCIWISNKLASTGMSHPNWPSERSVQPTISFSISTSDKSAFGLLHHIKAGDAGRKPLKYVIIPDSDLRHTLGLSVDDINRIKSQAPDGIDVVSAGSSEIVYESQAPIDSVREKSGAVVVECSYGDIPENRRSQLSAFNEAKNRFTKEPVGAVLLDAKRGIYGPLKEAYKYPA
jgi:GGDEF domain-containing protein